MPLGSKYLVSNGDARRLPFRCQLQLKKKDCAYHWHHCHCRLVCPCDFQWVTLCCSLCFHRCLHRKGRSTVGYRLHWSCLGHCRSTRLSRGENVVFACPCASLALKYKNMKMKKKIVFHFLSGKRKKSHVKKQ